MEDFLWLAIVPVVPLVTIGLITHKKPTLAFRAYIEEQISPPITHIALSCVPDTRPHSTVTRTGRAGFFGSSHSEYATGCYNKQQPRRDFILLIATQTNKEPSQA